MLSICYASTVWVVGRLVKGKHIFPSMLIFSALGISCILFVHIFFGLKNVYAAAVAAAFACAFSAALFVRFLIKDKLTALIYLPSFVFNSYAFVTALAIAMYN